MQNMACMMLAYKQVSGLTVVSEPLHSSMSEKPFGLRTPVAAERNLSQLSHSLSDQ